MRNPPRSVEGQTRFGPAILMSCTCAHFVKDHMNRGCSGHGGACHCDGRLFYKSLTGEYSSMKAKMFSKADEAETRDELAAKLAALNDDIRDKVKADAAKGIQRVGPM